MRIIFENGEILDCKNVYRVYMDEPNETYIKSNIGHILREEYSRGFKDGYKTGIVDYKTKHSGVKDIMEES